MWIWDGPLTQSLRTLTYYWNVSKTKTSRFASLYVPELFVERPFETEKLRECQLLTADVNIFSVQLYCTLTSSLNDTLI